MCCKFSAFQPSNPAQMRLVKGLKTFFSADCSVVEGFWRVQRQRHICYLRWKRCEKNYWTKQKGGREFLSSGCFTPLLIARGDCVKLTSQKLAWAQNIRQSWRRHRLTKSSCRRCDKRSQVKVRSRLNNDRWKLERSDLRMRQLRPPLTSQSHQQLVRTSTDEWQTASNFMRKHVLFWWVTLPQYIQYSQSSPVAGQSRQSNYQSFLRAINTLRNFIKIVNFKTPKYLITSKYLLIPHLSRSHELEL